MPDHGRRRRHQGGPGPLNREPGPCLLGLDVGTSTIKALLLDRDGRSQGTATVPTPFRGGDMTVEDLLAAVRRVCLEVSLSGGAHVAAVGIAGMAESGAPLDVDGRPLAPIIAWHDPRGASVVARLGRQFGPDLDHWIGQRLRTVSSVAKLGWLIDHGVGPVDRWLGVPELVLFALTGCQATEFSLAARTGAYHVGERRYLPSVVAALGCAPDVFPAVAGAGCVMSRISPAGAGWSGLPRGIPVTLAGHDHLVGMLGSGARSEDLANSVGTAEMVVAGDRPLPDVERSLALRVAVTVMPGGKGWALLASATRSGIVLSALALALAAGADELDVHARGGGRIDPSVATALIEAAVSGQPFALPLASPGEIWNGVLDALVTRTWGAVDRILAAGSAGAGDLLESTSAGVVKGPGEAGAAGGLPSVAGVVASGGLRPAVGVGDAPGLVVFGGGSRSRLWLEAKAAARPATPVWWSPAPEAVARGAARYAGVAAQWWPTPAAGPRLDLERA